MGFKEIDPKDLPNEIKEMMFGKKERPPSVFEHYGMSLAQAEEIKRKMLHDMIDAESKNEVIDKWFPELPAEKRAMLYCYLGAEEMMMRLAGD